MSEILVFFQSYFVNQAFLVTLILITFNNINGEVQIKVPLQIIRYILVLSGFVFLFGTFGGQNVIPGDFDNTLATANRFNGPYKVFYMALFLFSITLPFLLIFKKYGEKKYLILLFSFLLSLGYYYERFVMYVITNHRGHLNQGFYFQINSYSIRVALIIVLLTINLFLFIRKKSKIGVDKSEIDSELID